MGQKQKAFVQTVLQTDNAAGAAWEDVMTVYSLEDKRYDVTAFLSINIPGANDGTEYRFKVNGTEYTSSGRVRGKDSSEAGYVISLENVRIPKGNSAILQQVQIAGNPVTKNSRSKLVIKEA